MLQSTLSGGGLVLELRRVFALDSSPSTESTQESEICRVEKIHANLTKDPFLEYIENYQITCNLRMS